VIRNTATSPKLRVSRQDQGPLDGRADVLWQRCRAALCPASTCSRNMSGSTFKRCIRQDRPTQPLTDQWTLGYSDRRPREMLVRASFWSPSPRVSEGWKAFGTSERGMAAASEHTSRVLPIHTRRDMQPSRPAEWAQPKVVTPYSPLRINPIVRRWRASAKTPRVSRRRLRRTVQGAPSLENASM